MGATATEGNRIATLEWRPAFEVYQEIIKAQFGIELTRDNFYQYAVHYPFGILAQLYQADQIVGLDHDEQGFYIGGSIRIGGQRGFGTVGSRDRGTSFQVVVGDVHFMRRQRIHQIFHTLRCIRCVFAFVETRH